MIFDIPSWKLVLYIILFALIIISFYLTLRTRNKELKERDSDITVDKRGVPIFPVRKEDPREIKSLGSKLSCDTFRDIVGQRIKIGHQIQGTKSTLSGNPLEVDCYEAMSGLGLKYYPKSFYYFDGDSVDNKDVYEFYDRQYLNEVLKEQLKFTNNKLLEIPYTADMCEFKNNVLECEDKVPVEKRKERLKNYVKDRLIEVFS